MVTVTCFDAFGKNQIIYTDIVKVGIDSHDTAFLYLEENSRKMIRVKMPSVIIEENVPLSMFQIPSNEKFKVTLYNSDNSVLKEWISVTDFSYKGFACFRINSEQVVQIIGFYIVEEL
jgi:hypothetical protein